MKERTYIAIDLKSFYASVECQKRGLDPLDTNLVVADESRSDKTICLAVSPALKRLGIPGRDRLFAVRQRINEVNRHREKENRGPLKGKSVFASELESDKGLAADFITAVPRMALYMDVSAQIYSIYLKYIAPEDIHVYSIDEVFIDATPYLDVLKTDARQLAMTMILDVLETTGITATAGIGTNLYLCKVAMDIMAKHIRADENGVRIAELDEMTYRRQLWSHEPLTDFWRVGHGIAARLQAHGMKTMGDIALMSLKNEDLLYSLFGINAELLIDHAWGRETCLMEDIKAYKPQSTSLSQGQVLMQPYSFDKARLVLSEMADMLANQLAEKKLLAGRLSIFTSYDISNIKDGKHFEGEIITDFYGRRLPKGDGGSMRLERPSCLASEIISAALMIYDSQVRKDLLIKKLNVCVSDLMTEQEARQAEKAVQLDLFTDYERKEAEEKADELAREKEKKLQLATLSIKQRYGKNAILRLSSYDEGATARERNRQIGGHKA